MANQRYNHDEIQHVADSLGVTYETIRRKARIFLHKSDWSKEPNDELGIILKPQLVSNNLLILSGKPKAVKGYKGKHKSVYKAECQICGKVYWATGSTIMGRSQRKCCRSSRHSKKINEAEAARADTRPHLPAPGKLKRWSAMQVRYFSTDIDGCLCNGCWHWLKCSDALYECECVRNTDFFLAALEKESEKWRGINLYGSALARAGAKAVGMPVRMDGTEKLPRGLPKLFKPEKNGGGNSSLKPNNA